MYKNNELDKGSQEISPIASMCLSKMFITIVVMFIGYHLFGLTFETHTLITTTTSNPVTSISPHDRHFAASIWAFPDTILFHIFFECSITTFFRL